MTRRGFIFGAAATAPPGTAAEPRLAVPVRLVMDIRARYTPQHFQAFLSKVWAETVGDFSSGGILLQTSQGTGEIKRSPGGRPIFAGVERGAVNVVLTDHIPLSWDTGRALAGVTTVSDGYHVCVIALRYAHGNQIPFLSVNTCTHELLHALLQDVFVRNPKWYQADGREFRIDWYATRLWLFHDGSAIRESAQAYLDRLRGAVAARAR